MKKLFFILSLMTLIPARASACVGCSRLDVLESSVPARIRDEGVFQGNVTTFNFVGANVTASVSGGTVTVTVSTSASALPLPLGATNYLPFISTGTTYNIGASTMILSSASFGGGSGIHLFQSTVQANTGKFQEVFTSTIQGNSPINVLSDLNLKSSNLSIANGSFTISGNNSGFEIRGGTITANMLSSTSTAIKLGTPTWHFPPAACANGQVLKDNGAGVFTCSNDDNNISAGGGSTSPVRNYSIVIGTLGANNWEVDIASNTADGLREAVRRITGATNGTLGSGVIFYREGTYAFNGATVPKNVTVMAVRNSSAVWVIANASITASLSQPLVTVYGTLDGINIDAQQVAFQSKLIDLRGGSTLKNCLISGTTRIHTVNGPSIFSIIDSSSVFVEDNFFVDFADSGVTASITDPATFRIERSSNIWIRNNRFGRFVPKTAGAADAVIGVYGSSNVHIEGNRFDEAGGLLITSHRKGLGLFIQDNDFTITRSPSSRAMIAFWDDMNGVSSGVVVGRNSFHLRTNVSANVICVGQCNDAAQGSVDSAVGVVIEDNTVDGIQGNSWVFIKTASADAQLTVIKGNTVRNGGGFITDNGLNTRVIGNDNFLDETEQ